MRYCAMPAAAAKGMSAISAQRRLSSPYSGFRLSLTIPANSGPSPRPMMLNISISTAAAVARLRGGVRFWTSASAGAT